MDTTARERGLLAWQWSLYRDGHRNHVNLVVHLLTVPLFLAGTCAIPAACALGAWPLAAGGLAVMAVAVALQGRTHKREATPPAPFRSPFDVVARLFVEQWITFPRYLVSGELARAWRATR
jgi:hypothetical protein